MSTFSRQSQTETGNCDQDAKMLHKSYNVYWLIGKGILGSLYSQPTDRRTDGLIKRFYFQKGATNLLTSDSQSSGMAVRSTWTVASNPKT